MLAARASRRVAYEQQPHIPKPPSIGLQSRIEPDRCSEVRLVWALRKMGFFKMGQRSRSGSVRM